MKRRITAAFLALLLAMSLLIHTAASGGSSQDPVVSKSYVDDTFLPNALQSAAVRIDSAISSFKTKYLNLADKALSADISDAAFIDAYASVVLDKLQLAGKYLYSSRYMAPVSLESGEIIAAPVGTVITVSEGAVKCVSGNLINLTRGNEASSGASLYANNRYMFAENGGKAEIISNSAKVQIEGNYSLSGGYDVKYLDEAYALNTLGLVRGTGKGMTLHRCATRSESITMLIRLLGEEDEAFATKHAHPFTDVDNWVQNYVGFAYRMGYTKGISQTKYGGSNYTEAKQYMTFILRALGYSEEAGDFKYETAVSDSVRLGIIPKSFADEMSGCEFKRDHMIHISYYAVKSKLKNSNTTLLAKLVSNGTVSTDAANEFLNS